mgnify:CR=1 FL=1
MTGMRLGRGSDGAVRQRANVAARPRGMAGWWHRCGAAWPSTRRRGVVAVWLVVMLVGLTLGSLARAQEAEVPAAPAAQPAPAAPAVSAPQPQAVVPAAPAAPEAPVVADEVDPSAFRWSRPVVRVGQDYEQRVGDRVREAVIVLGSATIAGEVDRDVVVVLGSARLLPTAVIHGSLVNVGGRVIVAEGARVDRDFVVTAGVVETPPQFRPGGNSVVIGLPGAGASGDAVASWIMHGLLWGRLIVPSLAWLWVAAAVCIFLYLIIALLFDRPVRACRQVLNERPLSALIVGMLVFILIGPASFLLAVSVIGIPVLPFLVCGLIAATLVGKVGVSRWVGSGIIEETEPESRGHGLRSFFVGSGVILLTYMVPVLGMLAWAIGGTFGLGAATLAMLSGLRRENPSRPRRSVAAAAPVSTPVVAASMTPTPAVSSEGTWESGAWTASAVESPVDPTIPPVTPIPPVAPPLPSSGAGLDAAVALPKASFLDRLAAFALDVLLVIIAYNLLDARSERAFFSLLLAYHVVFWGLKATTVGGIICNLRVVRTDGAPLTFADALIRGFSSIFSLVALGLGCFWILVDPEKQAWHDRFAGTWVVKVPRNWPV